jgi:KDO2-lipid IV(A) lauroyltransferase
VLFVKVVRQRRGYYQIEIVPITDGQQPLSAEQIINRFAQHLETQIHQSPADWLWSHKRWKHEGKEKIE